MFTDRDLTSGFVPQILSLVGASPAGVDLEALAEKVKEKLASDKVPRGFEKTLERSILITLSFGLTEVRNHGLTRLLALKQSTPAPEPPPTPTQPPTPMHTPPSAAHIAGPGLGGAALGGAPLAAPAAGPGPIPDYQGAILGALAQGPLSPEALQKAVQDGFKAAGVLFDPVLYQVALAVLAHIGKVVKLPDGRFSLPTAPAG